MHAGIKDATWQHSKKKWQFWIGLLEGNEIILVGLSEFLHNSVLGLSNHPINITTYSCNHCLVRSYATQPSWRSEIISGINEHITTIQHTFPDFRISHRFAMVAGRKMFELIDYGNLTNCMRIFFKEHEITMLLTRSITLMRQTTDCSVLSLHGSTATVLRSMHIALVAICILQHSILCTAVL